MDENNIRRAIEEFKNKRVAVVGDIMLDHYTFGDVERISQEASTPVLKKTSDKFVLGGAANVAANLASLGAEVRLCGTVGADHNKVFLYDILKKNRINSDGIIEDASRPTIVKHRLVSGMGHQLLRVDEEDAKNLDADLEAKLFALIIAALDAADVVIFSDYAKGTFSNDLSQKVIALARKKNQKIVADFKPKNKAMFVGVDLIGPNLKEGREMSGEEEVEAVGKALIDYFGANVLLTRGADGVSVFAKADRSHHHFSGKKIKVFDVAGAGDTAISVAALGLASGLDLKTVALLANVAGSIVVQKPGTATLTPEELVSALRFENHIESLGVVPKVWGYEKWLENNDKYCSKLLSLNKGYQCSLHYHKVKDETFLVTKGHVRLEVGEKVLHLHEGGFMRIPPGTKHRFTGFEDSLIIEVSTHHNESDSYRIEESRSVDLA